MRTLGTLTRVWENATPTHTAAYMEQQVDEKHRITQTHS